MNILNLKLPVETTFALECKYREFELAQTNDLRENLIGLMKQLMLVQQQTNYAIKTGRLLENPQLELHQELELQHCRSGVQQTSRHQLIELSYSAITQIAVHQQVLSQLLV